MALLRSSRAVFTRAASLRATLVIVLAGLGVALSAQAQRIEADLSGPWKFIKQDAGADAAFDAWESVTIPHTWNNMDGQNGKAADPDQPTGYYRGPAWYARKLDIPAGWKGRRIFVKFDAAALVADVYLNGKHLGQHRGGFGAFVYEITDAAQPGGENILRVRVDNTKVPDVIPLSGDFTVFGGLYRPVHLFSTDVACITPLYYGSSGVFLTNKQITPAQATVAVETYISNGAATAGVFKIEADLLDAQGKLVKTVSVEKKIEAGTTEALQQPLVIEKPHLWNGRKDPYLYSVRVKLLGGGKVLDEVTQPLGLRTVQITDKDGFLLNGKPYALHGVNRHQEVMDKGWALTPEDDDADFKLIDEIGATCIRLAHYPQNGHVHDLCDRIGLIVWEEIPVVEQVSEDKDFGPTTLQQMKEMILQGYNHPSIAFWGIYNELYASWIKIKHPDAAAILTQLRDLAHELDPSRPVVAAAFTADPQNIQSIPDWQSLNTYPGWYWGTVDKMADTIKKATNTYKRKRIALSEYGAGANPTQHQEGKFTKPPSPDPNARGAFHPEEYQTFAHESYWSQIKDNPGIWGSYVWAMFDFASDGRNEGNQPGMNDKGLVTHDRKLKKDAFFFYKANWNPDPMVYIAARRNTPRKQAKTDVEVFSNNPAGAQLIVNGKSLGTVKPDRINVCRWANVPLKPGENKIEAVSKFGGKTLTDSCEWTLEKP
ncbi:MAG: glycoside hydrolase family 2 protein [Chthoniobacterales bacterium]